MLDTHSEREKAAAGTRTASYAIVAGAYIVALIALARWAHFVLDSTHTIAGRYDFSTYYAAALALRQNPHANIYDAGVLAHAGAAGSVLVQPPLAYTYPPLFAILLSPFTVLPFRVLSRIWLLGNAALWLALALLLASEVWMLVAERLPASTKPARLASLAQPLPATAIAATLWLTLSGAPAIQTLDTGQINILVLAPLVVVLWLTRHGHERWVGAAIALAAMLKFTPALLIVWLLLRRRWEAAASAILALLALAVLSAVVVGPETLFASFTQALRIGTHDASLGHNEALFAPILTGLRLEAHALAGIAAIAARLAQAALLLGAGYLAWRARGRGAAIENAVFGLGLCVMLLVSPVAWVHHYVWLLPAEAVALGLALGWLAQRLSTDSRSGRIVLLFLIAAVCVTLGWTLPHGWDTEPHPAITSFLGIPLWPWLLELRPLGAVLLGAALAWWISRRDMTVAGQVDRESGI